MIVSANNALDGAEEQFDQLEKPQTESEQVRANLKHNEMENVELAIKEMVKYLEELKVEELHFVMGKALPSSSKSSMLASTVDLAVGTQRPRGRSIDRRRLRVPFRNAG